MNDKLSLEARKDKAAFRIGTSTGSSVEIEFPEAPVDFFVGQNNTAVSYRCSDDVRAVIYPEGEKLIIALSREDVFPRPVSISFPESSLDLIDDEIVVDGTISLEIFDGVAQIDGSNASITMKGNLSRVEISARESTFSAMAQSSTRMKIYKADRVPEFRILVADDPAYSKLRPLRHGIPVISTVPVFYDSSTVDVAKGTMFEAGQAIAWRRIYFKALCDIPLTTSKIYLQISMPNGSGTFASPINIVMVANGTNTSFTASYVFHREDAINYIDGIARLRIHVPLTVEEYLPLGLDITSDGTGGSDGNGNAPEEEFTLFSIAELPNSPVLAQNEKFKAEEQSPLKGNKNKKVI